MWAEARKQERKIRGIMVDHKKRAERRREYYEKIKQDPAQFLQLSGRSCKLHIDHNLTGPEPPNTIMPWQGNANILIDRFDVRAHLDYIPEVQNEDKGYPEESKDTRPLNYERYRILVQNGFLKVKEEKFLKTLALEEKYGGKTYQQQKAEDDKRRSEKSKAAIGFTYEDSTAPTTKLASNHSAAVQDVNSDSDDDFDLDTVINFSALSREQQLELNSIGKSYFLGRDDFTKFLKHEAEEQEYAKTAKQEEDEKSAFSGRKSRKERRILKEKRLAGRIPSPPSYATYEHSSTKSAAATRRDSSSEESSRSPSPNRGGGTGKVEYITTFGDEKRPSKRSKKKRRRRSSSSSSSSDDNRGGSTTKYRSKYRRKRRSSSSSSARSAQGIQAPPPPPVKRYYGRKRDDSAEEKLTSDDSTEFKSECSSQMYSRDSSNAAERTTSTHQAKSGSGATPSFKDKLKKRMQSQLQKHYKADKKAEINRKIKAEEARMVREEELKEIMRKVKAKKGSDSSSDSDSDQRRGARRSRSSSSSSSSSGRCSRRGRSRDRYHHY